MANSVGIKSPFYIGNVKLDNNILLAPMAGITDLPFRVLCKEQGCGLVFTEMISAKGVYYGSQPSIELAKMDCAEKPVAVQIFGSEPELMAQAASIFQSMGAAIIDINMGCPTPKITSNGDGSALMKNTQLAGNIVKSVVHAVNIPVTVKIRRGWNGDNENAELMAKIIEENGAAAITVHGRYREQFYTGFSDREIISKVKRAVKIPVIGNGDIWTALDAKQLFEETGCDGVMVARGCQGNPWIFSRINSLLYDGVDLPPPMNDEIFNMIIRHMKMVIDIKGEDVGIREMRKHISWYLKGMKGSAIIRDKIFKCNKQNEIYNILGDYFCEFSITGDK